MPLIHIDVGYNFIILYTLIHLKWGWGEGDSNVTSHDYDGLYILDIFAFGKKMCILDFEDHYYVRLLSSFILNHIIKLFEFN